MRFSTQEEYGLRCLLRIGRSFTKQKALTIPEISHLENLSVHNVAKILRLLRLGGFLESGRGHTGGYMLSRPPDQIIIGDVLNLLGGRLFQEDAFCQVHSGSEGICTHTTDCSLRSLWKLIQISVDSVVSGLTLKDLLIPEKELEEKILSVNGN